ncbi:DUF3871 family protein [Chryseobacterium sp.]|uniref:DUF3871 family protein n=1 Tax=Chryseobacterium sp. TaxID=1871047 RepID=UPI0012CA08B4|nr:DUF3871 family protein [Chryseobacterium sp.]MPS66266.1 DUF3871 family protein [Chryseobacterium sp.]
MDTQSFSKTPNIIEVSVRLQESPVNIQLRNVSNQVSIEKKSIRDIFLDDSESFEDAEVFYPSKMNEEHPNVLIEKEVEQVEVQPFLMPVSPQNEVQIISTNNNSSDALVSQHDYEPSPFILANTEEVTLQHLKHDCIIPVFSKDNEKTIAHQEFIEIVLNAVTKVFPHHSISAPEIRVSHQIKGRIPEAIHKNVKDLLDQEKTIYYERMAFIIKIPSITDRINGNEVALSIGGVRSYNLENLYNKKTFEKFKLFIGFQNKVCCNLCVSTDGFLDDLRVGNYSELQTKSVELLQNYNAELHLMEMKELTQDFLSEHQFAQLIGRSRLYQHLPKSEKQNIPLLNFNDSHINTMAKDYYEDKNFCRQEDGRINLWDVYNLFTQANKSSYIDNFLNRNLNAFEFSKGIQKTLNGSSDYHWFLS